MGSYSLDLRKRIVKAHVKEGQNKSAVARRFGVSRWRVERYVKRAQPTPEEAELRRLQEENKRLKMEAEILKKASAFFARQLG